MLTLAACASTPPAPTAQLQAARLAISNAQRTDASRHAAANAAVLDKRMVAAAQFAEQSRVEAELALARKTGDQT